jgi:RNA-splicing ligase RtcB
MVHSGSRALGPAIRGRHFARAQPFDHGLRGLDAGWNAGSAYLQDASYARRFADASRRVIAEEAGRVLFRIIGAEICWDTVISTDHNHVSLERLGGRDFWVHRKGAMPARPRAGFVLKRAWRWTGVEPDRGSGNGRLCKPRELPPAISPPGERHTRYPSSVAAARVR